jgi:hypothetical protein
MTAMLQFYDKGGFFENIRPVKRTLSSPFNILRPARNIQENCLKGFSVYGLKASGLVNGLD